MQGAKFFSTIDLAQGYHQCRLHPDDVPKTAFRSRYGAYQWKVMNFGLSNAVPVFVRLLNQVLQPVLGVCAMCFIDDIIIYSKTREQHKKDVRAVCDLLVAAGMYANWGKCYFFQDEVDYCGFVIHTNGVRPQSNKIKAIEQWEPPKTLYHVRSFLGAVGFYRRFIHNFAKIALPLTNLTKSVEGRARAKAVNITISKWGRTVKTENLMQGEWTDKCQKAFDKLKHAITHAPVLILPDHSKPFEMMTDCSKGAVGAVLMQRNEEGKLQPCAYFSVKLTAAEAKYPVHEFELVAIFKSIKHWRHMLIGNQTTIHTDHKPLTHILSQPKLSDRQARWITFLADYDINIVAVQGTQNVVADALSRYPFDDTFVTKTVDDLKQTFVTQSLSAESPTVNYSEVNSYAQMCMLYEITGFANISAITPHSVRHMFMTPSGINLPEKVLQSEVSLNFLGGHVSGALSSFESQSDFFPDIKDPDAVDEDAMDIDFVPPVIPPEVPATAKLGEMTIKESIQKGYETDILAKNIIAGQETRLDMRYIDGFILYYDQSDTVRLYIPSTSVIQLPLDWRTTEFPISGEIIRTECGLRESLITDVHNYGHVCTNKTLE